MAPFLPDAAFDLEQLSTTLAELDVLRLHLVRPQWNVVAAPAAFRFLWDHGSASTMIERTMAANAFTSAAALASGRTLTIDARAHP